MSREGALWIGGLEPYMDEDFMRRSLSAMGEDNVISIKVIKNKFTGEPASYGFINFDSDHNALIAMHKLNGKLIPNTSPPVRFKLNHQSTRLMPGEKDHSIWVGDLTPDVDDLQLYKFFSARFQTIKSAKVVLDGSGFSKGYGFIRFGSDQEQQTALATMIGVGGLGAKPIKVSLAIPKGKTPGIPSSIEAATAAMVSSGASVPSSVTPATTAEADYSQYWQNYSQYWSQYAAWSQYSQQYQYPYDYSQGHEPVAGETPEEPAPLATSKKVEETNGDLMEGDDFELVEHSAKLDDAVLNNRLFARTEELWDSIEESRWWREPDTTTMEA